MQFTTVTFFTLSRLLKVLYNIFFVIVYFATMSVAFPPIFFSVFFLWMFGIYVASINLAQKASVTLTRYTLNIEWSNCGFILAPLSLHMPKVLRPCIHWAPLFLGQQSSSDALAKHLATAIALCQKKIHLKHGSCLIKLTYRHPLLWALKTSDLSLLSSMCNITSGVNSVPL